MKLRSITKLLLFLLVLGGSLTAQGNWTRQESKTLAWLHDIYFLNESKGWITGSNGEFLVTVDGGKTWDRQTKFTDDTIREVHFFDENNGWLLCERDFYNLGGDAASYLLTTSDGGKTWTTVNFENEQRRRVTRLFFNENDRALAIGESGILLSVRENRSEWKKLPSPVPFLLNDGVFVDRLRGAIVGGGGTILMTEDAGLTWKTSFISGKVDAKLNSVFFRDGRTGWAVGENGVIYQTINGGSVWRRQISNVTANLTDIYFINSAEGWAVGENGTLLYSNTAGNVWTQLSSNIGHKLERILFVGKRGWIVGFGGTILHFENGGDDGPAGQQPIIRTRN